MIQLRPATNDGRSHTCTQCGVTTPDTMFTDCCGVPMCFNCRDAHEWCAPEWPDPSDLIPEQHWAVRHTKPNGYRWYYETDRDFVEVAMKESHCSDGCANEVVSWWTWTSPEQVHAELGVRAA